MELCPVGKEAGNHPVPQEEIEALLIRRAREGKRVVRFKGGDPCIFGRGGEEAESLSRAGIAFEIVPGVTAGIAVPIYAGIPVTFRDEAVRVTLVTAHESIKKDGPQVRWDLLARDPSATLVGFMGVSALRSVAASLLAAGIDPDVPAAIVERGTTSAQKVVRAPLRDLAGAAEAAGIRPPALFVIGTAVRHAAHLDWFSGRPLFGHRILVASPAGEPARCSGGGWRRGHRGAPAADESGTDGGRRAPADGLSSQEPEGSGRAGRREGSLERGSRGMVPRT